MKDQFEKAVEKGFIFRFLNMINKKWTSPPNKLYIKDILKVL